MLTIGLLVGLSVVFAALVGGGIIALGSRNSEVGGIVCIVLGGMFLFATLLITIIMIPSMHGEVLAIPFKIAALERTIDQQKELIAVDATLGQGLEGLEIKQEIQSNIRELNDLIARSEYITISPWWMFKPNMGDS